MFLGKVFWQIGFWTFIFVHFEILKKLYHEKTRYFRFFKYPNIIYYAYCLLPAAAIMQPKCSIKVCAQMAADIAANETVALTWHSI
jgi:hypothetical protein